MPNPHHSAGCHLGLVGSTLPRVELSKWLGALKEKNFCFFFVGQTASQVGTGMAPVAISFAVLEHGSASDVGYVLAAGTVPLVLFLLIGGVLADRISRRIVMLGSDLMRGLAEGALGVWILSGRPPLWGFMLIAALVGTGQAFFSPAMTGLVPQIISDENLQQANALNGLSESSGSIVGPAIAGIIIATSSPGWAIMVDAASYLISVGTLALVHVEWTTSETPESFTFLLRQGWSEFWARKWLWVMVVQSSLANMLVFAPYLVLGPLIAKESLGGARSWGLILASQGAGAVLGGIVMLGVKPRYPLRTATLATFVWIIPLITLAYRAPVIYITIGAFIAGFSLAIIGAQWDTTMQREIPPELLSRVSAYDWFGSLLFLPIGMILIGPLAHDIGTTASLVAAAALMAIILGAVLMVPSVTSLEAQPRK
jgi:MFS family permease